MQGMVMILQPYPLRGRGAGCQARIRLPPFHGSRYPSLFAATLILTFVAMLVGLPVGASAGELQSDTKLAGRTVAMTLRAHGVQIYECKAANGGALAWSFREPLATLIRDDGTIGRHFAGPSWQLTDGSGVTGKVVTQVAGETPHDIAWLGLDVASHIGSGAMSEITAVQRVNTRGGVFGGSCNQAGAIHLEPYSADYIFLKG
jgi:Protein of unknown function (DUF3455)